MNTTPTAYLVLVAVPPRVGQLGGPLAGVTAPPVGQAFKLLGSNDIIGRLQPPNHTSATIVLPWSFVSRRHAQIELTGAGAWEIEDLQSRNGTYVNGQVLQPHARTPLAVGARISIGSPQCGIELEFHHQLGSSVSVRVPDAGDALRCDDDADESITVPALTR